MNKWRVLAVMVSAVLVCFSGALAIYACGSQEAGVEKTPVAEPPEELGEPHTAQDAGAPQSVPAPEPTPEPAREPEQAVLDASEGVATSAQPETASASEPSVAALDDGSFLCTPAGTGPFPGVLYNHGGRATVVGGDLEGTCLALAEAGYIGYSKQRRLSESHSIAGHIDDVYEGLNALLAADGVDASRVGIMGFSRGGLLTLQAATERPGTFSAIVAMAPASAKGLLATVLGDTDQIDAPVLVLVSENDLFQDDHVTLTQNVVGALEAEDKHVEHILYGPFGDDGHERFFVVGDYWGDIIAFLSPHL